MSTEPNDINSTPAPSETTQTTNTESTATTAAPSTSQPGEKPESTNTESQTLAEKISSLGKTAPATAPIVDPQTGQVVPPKAPYTPNFKYRVMDKEMEFDENLKKLIQDKDSEEAIRQLLTKAGGLDRIKQDQSQTRQELQTEKQTTGKYKQVIDTAMQFRQKKDYNSFFQFLDIPEADILQYALERVQYRELSPEQRAQIDGQQSAHLRAVSLEQQNQSLQANYEQVAQATRRMEISQELSKPQVSEFVQNFDARAGRPGAFQQAVIERGKYHWLANHVDIPVAQAVQEVLWLAQGAGPQAPLNPATNEALPPSPTGASQAPAQSHQTQQRTIIPNIRGNGTSPVKTIPKNLNDLRKLAAQKLD